MNLHELLNMGGYGLYVWPAYLITVLVFCINLYVVFYEKKQVKKMISSYEQQT